MNTRVGEAPSRGLALVHSLGTAPADMMLASRPRTHELLPESVRAAFEMGHDDIEDSQYLFASPPSAATISDTAVHITPVGMGNHLETQGQEEVAPCEITQNGLKFKGNVRGIKITATQIASKIGRPTSEHRQPGDEEQTHQPQGQGKKNKGIINQNGAQFFQSVTDTDAEVSQSAGGKAFYIVKQDAAEFEGDATGGSYNFMQHVW